MDLTQLDHGCGQEVLCGAGDAVGCCNRFSRIAPGLKLLFTTQSPRRAAKQDHGVAGNPVLTLKTPVKLIIDATYL